jgi:hypothetical protein
MQEKGLQSPPGTAHHPKTQAAEGAVAAVAEEPASGTAEIRIVVPRTAPQSFICLILLFFALFYLLIVFAPIILTPLPDISVHII